MNEKTKPSPKPLPANLRDLLPKLEALYTDIHAHPELSMQETRTAGLAAERLRAAGYEVTDRRRQDRRRRPAAQRRRARP